MSSWSGRAILVWALLLDLIKLVVIVLKDLNIIRVFHGTLSILKAKLFLIRRGIDLLDFKGFEILLWRRQT